MVKTAIQHYVIEYALKHLFEKYTNEFTQSKYITYKDLNKTHLYRYINEFNSSYGLMLVGGSLNRNIIIQSMQIVQYSDIKHILNGAYTFNSDVYYVLVSAVRKNGSSCIAKYPFLYGSSAILK